MLDALRAMIDAAHGENAAFRKAAQEFLDHARKTINPGLAAEDVREILIQHILTDEIFDEVCPGQPFHKDNNVARELHKLEETFFSGNLKFQALKGLEVYYRAIRSAAARISGYHEKRASSRPPTRTSTRSTTPRPPTASALSTRPARSCAS